MKVGKKSSNGVMATEVVFGTHEEMIQTRKDEAPGIIAEIEKFLENYAGGGIAIAMNKYDDDGNVIDQRTLVTGVDEPKGMMELAYGLDKASRKTVEMICESLGKDAFIEMAKSLLREVGRSKK